MYAEVWRLPMTKIADHHRVSSSFLARVCTRMNVPRPPRGHWVKLANGIRDLSHPCLRLGLVTFSVGAAEMLLVQFLDRYRGRLRRAKLNPNSSAYRDQGSILLSWGHMRSLSRGASSTKDSSSQVGSAWWMSW